MSSLVDIFNDKSNRFIVKQPWMIINKNLTQFEKYKVSFSLTTLQAKITDLDTNHILVTTLKSEMNREINRRIIKKLFETRKFDLLDLRPDGSILTGKVYLEKLVSILLTNGYRNMITTGLISSELQDSINFTRYATSDDLRVTGNTECFGKLGGFLNVYNDPYMKYSDTRICLFNEVDFNIGEINAYEYETATAPQVVVEYEFAYNVIDSKLVFLIETESTEAFTHWKTLQRDIKINQIIDGD